MATKSEIEADLAMYRAARNAILAAQAYSINGRAVTRADLKTVTSEISRLEAALERKNRGGRMVKAPIFGA